MTSMIFVEKVRRDLTTAMKAGDRTRVSTLRLLMSDLHNAEIERKRPLQTEDVALIVLRMIRQRRESIKEFSRGGREDLVKKEEQELEILQEYSPKMMEEEEIEKYVEEAVAEVSARELRDLGRVMAVLMPKLSGKAEGSLVNRIVREKLVQKTPSDEES